MKIIALACTLALSALPAAAALAAGPPAMPCTAETEGEHQNVVYPRYYEVFLCTGGTWIPIKRCFYESGAECIYW
ncbi:hypothetical protein [Luteimonas huabeiensis]|uniref:hypothetical protein n=1 Tax=Luteimonas huabeiensis TaxID=1244513 RepID=UPI000467B4E8|nr:hypothetical protein [Luteimonas huabeiensis]